MPRSRRAPRQSCGQARTPSRIRVIALDFDLTIYDFAAPQRTLELASHFVRLRRRGVVIGIASGRTVEQLQQPLEQIGFPGGLSFADFVICNEGEIRTADGRDFYGAAEWNARRCDRLRQVNAVLLPLFEQSLSEALASGCECIRPICCGTAGVNVVFKTPAQAELVRSRLAEAARHMAGVRIARNHHIVLGVPPDAGKGAALAEVARLYGSSPDQVLAIGDNLNDACMLCDGHGFRAAVVGNADASLAQQVVAAGGYLAKDRVSEGVIEIFKHFVSD